MKEIILKAEREEIPKHIACHLMAFGRIIERGNLIIVTMPKNLKIFSDAGLNCTESIQDAIRKAQSKSGKEDGILVLSKASGIVPLIID